MLFQASTFTSRSFRPYHYHWTASAVFFIDKPAGFMRDSPYHPLSHPLPFHLFFSLLFPTIPEEIPGKWEAEYSYDNLSTIIPKRMIAANVCPIIFQYFLSPSFLLAQVFIESEKLSLNFIKVIK